MMDSVEVAPGEDSMCRRWYLPLVDSGTSRDAHTGHRNRVAGWARWMRMDEEERQCTNVAPGKAFARRRRKYVVCIGSGCTVTLLIAALRRVLHASFAVELGANAVFAGVCYGDPWTTSNDPVWRLSVLYMSVAVHFR